jgi:phenylalanyl-tRNA synthetase beta chain
VESRYVEHRDVSYHDLKGDLEALLALSGVSVSWQASTREYLHPWQSADLMVEGDCIGWLGAIHPRWLGQLGFKGRAFGFELSLESIRKTEVPAFSPVPVYPSVRRDLSIVMADTVKWCDISELIENNSDNLLTNLVVFDEYKGPGIGEGKTSLALGIVLQDRSGTLKDEQVDTVISQIVDVLNRELNVELRR